jgi:hypothetical protein
MPTETLLIVNRLCRTVNGMLLLYNVELDVSLSTKAKQESGTPKSFEFTAILIKSKILDALFGSRTLRSQSFLQRAFAMAGAKNKPKPNTKHHIFNFIFA